MQIDILGIAVDINGQECLTRRLQSNVCRPIAWLVRIDPFAAMARCFTRQRFFAQLFARDP